MLPIDIQTALAGNRNSLYCLKCQKEISRYIKQQGELCMNKQLVAIAALICLTVVSHPQPSHALTCGNWKDAEKSIRGWWSQAYPAEKILAIEQGGPATTYSKTQSTGQKKIDEYGNEWEYYKKNPYCSIPAKVKVQQSSGKRIFNVSAIYKVSGKRFTFDDLATGDSEAMPEPGQAAAPELLAVKKVIIDAINTRIPPSLKNNLQVEKVMIAPRKLRTLEKGQATYQMTSVELFMIVDGVPQGTCEIGYTWLHKGTNENNMRLDGDGPWRADFMQSDTVPGACSGKYRSAVHDYVTTGKDTWASKAAPREARPSSPVAPSSPKTVDSESDAPNLNKMLKGFGF
jgi:hypothetical protein